MPAATAVFLVFVLAVTAQQPPRDRVPSRDAAIRGATIEATLAKKIEASPGDPAAYYELSTLQEGRGALAEAEATLVRARQAFLSNTDVALALSGFYNRQGQFEKTMAMLDIAAQLDPGNPQVPQIIATYYQEKVSKDTTLDPTLRGTYIREGIAATDRALALNPDYVEALVYKNILLRMRALLETDPVRRTELIADADRLRNRALELRKDSGAVSNSPTAARPGPPPPPPPPVPGRSMDGMAPVRVGGNIKPPTKTRDVRPVYPPEAQTARVAGVVIIEVTIDPSGRVSSARVMRSIPPLDQAAIDAVSQWEFTPTELDGRLVPVIMTVTVNFTLQ